MSKVRMAIVGTGGMGSGHAKMVQNIEEVQLVAAADSRLEAAQKVGTAYSIPAYGDYREMFVKEKLDFILIATPHPAHMKVAVDAFKAGLHVLSEKPLASNLIEADKMLQAAEKHGKLLGTMFQMRTEPAKRRMHEIVSSGMLGDVCRVNMIASNYRTQAYYNSGTWRGTWAGEGGGVLINQAPHDLDQFIWIGGRPTSVFGAVETRLHDIEVEDSATAMVTYANGGRGYFHTSTVEHPNTWRIEVCGDKGKVIFENNQIKLYLLETPISVFTKTTTVAWSFPPFKEEPVEIEQCPSGHAEVTRDFAHAIMENRPPIAPGSEGILSLELANAMIYSSHVGKPVSLPLNRRAYDRFFKEKCKGSKYRE